MPSRRQYTIAVGVPPTLQGEALRFITDRVEELPPAYNSEFEANNNALVLSKLEGVEMVTVSMVRVTEISTWRNGGRSI